MTVPDHVSEVLGRSALAGVAGVAGVTVAHEFPWQGVALLILAVGQAVAAIVRAWRARRGR